jgi:hypothetical protein
MTVDMVWLQAGVDRDRRITQQRRQRMHDSMMEMLPPKEDLEQFILRDYDPGTYGEEYIKEEDVVRPLNHRFSRREDEEHHWLYKSVPKCPTYGTCVRCYRTGPVGNHCNSCSGDEHTALYTVIYYKTHILDSITLSEALCNGYAIARADRIYPVGIRFPSMSVNIDWLEMAIGYDSSNTAEKRHKIYAAVIRMLPE